MTEVLKYNQSNIPDNTFSFFIEIKLTCSIILILSIQCNDSVFVYTEK